MLMPKKHILVVNDGDAICASLKQAIENPDSNFQVTLTPSGRAAREALQRQSFDLMIAHFKMKDVDGLELVENINHSWPEMPVMLLSGDNPAVPGNLIAVLLQLLPD